MNWIRRALVLLGKALGLIDELEPSREEAEAFPLSRQLSPEEIRRQRDTPLPPTKR